MSERLLNAATKVATFGRYGIQVNPKFTERRQQLENETRDAATKFYDRGTLVIIDDDNKRIITKYQFVKKGDNDWGSNTPHSSGDGTFLEGSGKSLNVAQKGDPDIIILTRERVEEMVGDSDDDVYKEMMLEAFDNVEKKRLERALNQQV